MNSKSDLTPPSNDASRDPLAPHLAELLRSLRTRIRRYVWLEGLAAALAWMGLVCWVTLLADWFFEPSAPVRVGLLLAAGVGLLIVVLEFIVRRAFRPLSDSTLALLLERRYRQFQQTLLTTVELRDRPAQADGHSPEMLAATAQQAAERAAGIEPRAVLNPRPLRNWSAAAAGLAGTFLLLGLTFPGVLSIWSQRVLLLSDDLWPRRTRLVLEGFPDGVAKVARGADLELIVGADTRMPLVPQVVQVRSRREGGRAETSPMSRLGAADPARDRYQQYSHTFEGVLAPIRFDLYGGDDAIRDLQILVVDSPTLVDVSLLCHYPAYMHRTDRRVPAVGAAQVPQGTEVVIAAKANKPLVEVRVQREGDEAPENVQTLDLEKDSGPAASFRLPLGVLQEETTLLFTLRDADGIRSREPIRLTLAAIPDQPPELAVKLRGIGSAVTPQARIPAAGQVTDDYGIADVWFEHAVDEAEPVIRRVIAPRGSPTELSVEPALEVRDLGLAAGQKLRLRLRASDHCDLAGKPNLGTTEQWVLDVVTPEQLRAMLEARELVLRQRFEATLAEVIESRDLLTGLHFEADKRQQDEAARRSATAVDSPAESTPQAVREPGDATAETLSAEQERAMRSLRVERVGQNSQKNADECLGLAESFDDIRLQLVNNRVDTPELNERLQEGIAGPLRRIVEEMYPELEVRLARLERTLDDSAVAAESRDLARAQLDNIVVAMRGVLGRMIEMEDFNEAVEMLRTIIARQEEILEKTRTEHKSSLRGLLDD